MPVEPLKKISEIIVVKREEKTTLPGRKKAKNKKKEGIKEPQRLDLTV